jgi:hypothetical protein
MKRTAFTAALALLVLAGGGAWPQTSSPLTAPDEMAPPQPVTPQMSETPATCEAASLTYLVGKPRTMIPVPVDPSHRRVSCTTCPVTMDYRPERTDILFDARTGLITEVKCG